MKQETPWSHLISVDRIAGFHEFSMDKWGGLRGPPTEGCLEGRVGSAWNAVCYSDTGLQDAGLAFAAYLIFYLCRDHCYADGNKRVAWMSGLWVLLRLGLTVSASTEEGLEFMLGITEKRVTSGEQVMDWLAPRLIARERN